MFRTATIFALVATLALSLIAGLGGGATATGQPTRGKGIPAELEPPASSFFLHSLKARGVQIYACAAKPEEPRVFVWTPKGPEAELRNERGELVGRHFGGPTWQAQDGSAVVATVVASSKAPGRNAVPWLLLEATEHSGNGAFVTVTYIQRFYTTGGAAPRKGCDAAHDGKVVRVPYEATYAFYYPTAPTA